jgi:hypothetical protein
MHVFRSLDDALLTLRNALVLESLPVLIKVVDEKAGRELHVFKIDVESPLEEEHRLVVQGEDAMEVDDSSSDLSSSSSHVTDEVAASMLQLVEEASNKVWNEAPPRAVANDDVAATTSESDEGDDSININAPKRRSDRQTQPIGHVVNVQSSSGAATKRKSASVRQCQTRKKVRQRGNADDGDELVDDGREGNDDGNATDEESQIVALTDRLKEAYERRSSVAVDAASPSKVLDLVRQVLAQSQADEAQPPSLLQQCAMHVTSLITTGTAQKMVGYYLRSVLAHHLKQSSQRQYSRLARCLLGIQSSTDIASYPVFCCFIQRHCPSIAAATADGNLTEEVVSEWLREPLFIADMSWSEWRRYLSRSHLHIAEAAVQRFSASIESFKDWIQLGLVEMYDDEQLCGKGIRALRDIHLPKGKGKRDVSVVAADLYSAGAEFVKVQDPTQEADPEYLIRLDKQRVFDARHHWIGKINHLPMPHCNLKVSGNGKLVQIKSIKAGDALTLDYGVDYWVYQVTGLDASEWMCEGGRECQRGRMDLFTRMHESTLDYSKVLREKWARSLSSSACAVQREGLLVDMEDYLNTSQTR